MFVSGKWGEEDGSEDRPPYLFLVTFELYCKSNTCTILPVSTLVLSYIPSPINPLLNLVLAKEPTYSLAPST